MKTTPIKGTRDYLPREVRVRDYVQNQILNVYRQSGFVRIATPMLEDMENLDKSDGGDNLNLIFKILKRGEKLDKALAANDTQKLADLGLRYDLTLPLSRYYAANQDALPSPCKVIQTDRVFRAERPQKGRMREFVQCDIDILGDESTNAEIELIDVTARALRAVDLTDVVIHINDRRMLRSMLLQFGFAPETLDTVCVSFDKLDKIGEQGVTAELTEKDMPADAVAQLSRFLQAGDFSLAHVAKLLRAQDRALAEDLLRVMDAVRAVANGAYAIAYTPQLVRGQGYYTGVVFEVTCPGFAGAVGGGGRYDDMVGKFLGQKVPAVGFSIGFERIIGILLDKGFAVPEERASLALLYRADADFADVLQKAAALRTQYAVTVLAAGKKVAKQLERLADDGCSAVCFYEKYPEVKQLSGHE
ncbi:MAG: histidine--tRNA ligase, partial [Ruthenibacterium sp.]